MVHREKINCPRSSDLIQWLLLHFNALGNGNILSHNIAEFSLKSNRNKFDVNDCNFCIIILSQEKHFSFSLLLLSRMFLLMFVECNLRTLFRVLFPWHFSNKKERNDRARLLLCYRWHTRLYKRDEKKNWRWKMWFTQSANEKLFCQSFFLFSLSSSSVFFIIHPFVLKLK